MKKIIIPFVILIITASCKKEKVCHCLVKYDPPLQDVHRSKRMTGSSSSLNSQCDKFGDEVLKEFSNGNRVECSLK